MSMRKEDAFAELTALEAQIPTLKTHRDEEWRWIYRVGLFIQHMNAEFPIPKHLSERFAQTCTDRYKHPGLWCEREVVAPYPGEKALKKDIKKHKREGRKEFFSLYRDYIEGQYKYMDMRTNAQPPQATQKHERAWLYWANGKAAYLKITGKVFLLNDPRQSRGKNAAVHLLDLLSFPDRVGVVTEEEFKRRVIGAGERYANSKNSNTFVEAIHRINDLVGKTPSGKEFLSRTIQGCSVNEAFIAEFEPGLAQT